MMNNKVVIQIYTFLYIFLEVKYKHSPKKRCLICAELQNYGVTGWFTFKNPHPQLSNKSGLPASMPLGKNCTNCPILHCRVV